MEWDGCLGDGGGVRWRQSEGVGEKEMLDRGKVGHQIGRVHD